MVLGSLKNSDMLYYSPYNVPPMCMYLACKIEMHFIITLIISPMCMYLACKIEMHFTITLIIFPMCMYLACTVIREIFVLKYLCVSFV